MRSQRANPPQVAKAQDWSLKAATLELIPRIAVEMSPSRKGKTAVDNNEDRRRSRWISGCARRAFVVNLAAGFIAAAGCAMPACAGGLVAMDRPETAAHGALSVTSTGFRPNAALPAKYSARSANRSPPLQWSQAPGARSYAVLVEDPDAPGASPHVHWLAWNIPASVSALPEGVPTAPRIVRPVAMEQGRNGAQTIGYSGPNPPPGSSHHYHFEVFALDAMLQAPPPGSDRAPLLAAMRGHVLAKGDVVATYQQ